LAKKTRAGPTPSTCSAHERTNIADVNRAKRELERLKRIAKAEGVYDDMRFRDEIAKLEVDVVALGDDGAARAGRREIGQATRWTLQAC